jgi:hypothetical protein
VGGTRPSQETVLESNQELLPPLPAVLPPPPVAGGQQIAPALQPPSAGAPNQTPYSQGNSGVSPDLGNRKRMLTTGPDLHNDQALTVDDHKLLGEVREQVLPALNVTAAESPVQFILRNGVVILTGSVSSEHQRQKVVELVRQTPGVVSVVDELDLRTAGRVRPSIVHQSGDTSTNLSATGRDQRRAGPESTRTRE